MAYVHIVKKQWFSILTNWELASGNLEHESNKRDTTKFDTQNKFYTFSVPVISNEEEN